MINFYKENNIQSIFLFFGIIFFCFFLSLKKLLISNNIDEALSVGGIIIVPDSNSPQLEFISNTKNLLVYLIVLLIKIGFSYNSISNILSFISTLFFFIGIFLVLKNIILYISEKYINIISFISTCLFIISDTHLPHTDYPNAYFASFTVGIYSIAISTLIFGLIIDGREKLTFFFSVILLLIHPVQGAWVVSILIILNFCDKIFIKKNYNKAYLKNLLLLIIAIVITITLL